MRINFKRTIGYSELLPTITLDWGARRLKIYIGWLIGFMAINF